jgi:hypothetical protein
MFPIVSTGSYFFLLNNGFKTILGVPAVEVLPPTASTETPGRLLYY